METKPGYEKMIDEVEKGSQRPGVTIQNNVTKSRVQYAIALALIVGGFANVALWIPYAKAALELCGNDLSFFGACIRTEKLLQTLLDNDILYVNKNGATYFENQTYRFYAYIGLTMAVLGLGGFFFLYSKKRVPLTPVPISPEERQVMVDHFVLEIAKAKLKKKRTFTTQFANYEGAFSDIASIGIKTIFVHDDGLVEMRW